MPNGQNTVKNGITARIWGVRIRSFRGWGGLKIFGIEKNSHKMPYCGTYFSDAGPHSPPPVRSPQPARLFVCPTTG